MDLTRNNTEPSYSPQWAHNRRDSRRDERRPTACACLPGDLPGRREKSAGASGTALTLLGMPEGALDMTLSSMARNAALAAITSEIPIYRKAGSAEAAIALRVVLNETAPLSEGERSLLVEWLERLAAD